MADITNDDFSGPIQAPGERINVSSSASSAGNKPIIGKRPNKRQKNPLGDYASVTYQLSLYMMTPDAYHDFVNADRQNIGSLNDGSGKGAFLIAQSGGVNDNTSVRANGFHFDYYIDNLKIHTAVTPKATGTAAAVTELSFDIIEPFGFSFITNLKRAANQIDEYTKTKNVQTPQNPSREFFVIGLRFFGYDAQGNIASDANGMFERYYDIVLTGINFNIDGRMTRYAITAAGTSVQTSLGIKRGRIKKGATVKGRTIRDLLEGTDKANGKFGLFAKLNQDEADDKKFTYKNKYSVKFIGEDADAIANATVVSKADMDKARMAMSNVSSTLGVNPATGEKVVLDVNSREVTFKDDTPILQAIQQLISQSSYILDALKEVNTSALQPDKTGERSKIEPDTKKVLRWYSVTPKVENPRYDPKAQDFSFDITYIIQSYKTPVILNTSGNKTDLYYGPAKRYDYWYTGQNTEILKYSQTMNNLYFTVVLDPGSQETDANGKGKGTSTAGVPTDYSRKTNQSRQGGRNQATAVPNQYVTQLNDPGAYATANIEILGDPDFLFQPVTGNLEKLEDDYDPFYGLDGYSINPHAGQVFVEVDFKEAVDYDTETGVLDINDNIVFWEYPKTTEIQGISYLVNEVTSFFRSGRFTQELSCTINTFDDDGNSSSSTIDSSRESENANSSTNDSNQNVNTQIRTGVVGNTKAGAGRGFVQPPKIPAPQTHRSPTPPVTNNTNNGDDDYNPNPGYVFGA